MRIAFDIMPGHHARVLSNNNDPISYMKGACMRAMKGKKACTRCGSKICRCGGKIEAAKGAKYNKYLFDSKDKAQSMAKRLGFGESVHAHGAKWMPGDKNDMSQLDFKKGGSKKDSCYYQAKEKYDVFPSAYASGYIAKCHKNRG